MAEAKPVKKFYFWRTVAAQIFGGSFVLVAFGFVWQNVPSIAFVDRAIAAVFSEVPRLRQEIKDGDEAVLAKVDANIKTRAAIRDGERNLTDSKVETLTTKVSSLETTIIKRIDHLEELIIRKRVGDPPARSGVALRRQFSPAWFFGKEANGEI